MIYYELSVWNMCGRGWIFLGQCIIGHYCGCSANCWWIRKAVFTSTLSVYKVGGRSAVPLYFPLWGIRKKVGNNDLQQGALPTQNTLPWRHHSRDLWASGFYCPFSSLGTQTPA